MELTREKFLRDKENKIKSFFSHGEKAVVRTYDFLHKYYMLKNLSGDTPILSVFEAIYINNLNLPAWKLAIRCNLSRTTLFNYRNAIIKDFDICLKEDFINEEIVVTKGETK